MQAPKLTSQTEPLSGKMPRGRESRWKLSRIFGNGQEFVLDTQGENFVITTEPLGRPGAIKRQSPALTLEAATLRTALADLDYAGQPISVILHPPCVCLKVMPLESGNPDMWLASHLPDISPPVSRRELVMSYQHTKANQLLVAFVRRSFIATLRVLFRECRISVNGIYVGGAIASEAVRDHELGVDGAAIRFALCKYHLHREGSCFQIFADFSKSSLAETSATSNAHKLTDEPFVTSSPEPSLPPNLSTVSLRSQSLDFRIQAELPKAQSPSRLTSVLRAEILIAAILLSLFILYWGARSIGGGQMADSDYQSATLELGRIRQQNEARRVELDKASRVTMPELVACNFLKVIATMTPAQTVLHSITFEGIQSEGVAAFGLTGYSKDSNGPLEFADSLRSCREIKSVALTRVGLVDALRGNLDEAQNHQRWTRFEMAGEYAGN